MIQIYKAIHIKHYLFQKLYEKFKWYEIIKNYETDEESLRSELERYGPIKKVKLLNKWYFY